MYLAPSKLFIHLIVISDGGGLYGLGEGGLWGEGEIFVLQGRGLNGNDFI